MLEHVKYVCFPLCQIVVFHDAVYQNGERILLPLNSLFSNSPQYTLFAPQILHKLLFSNALGDTAYSQEHLKTMVYAKFGGQTKCIMGNLKIANPSSPVN